MQPDELHPGSGDRVGQVGELDVLAMPEPVAAGRRLGNDLTEVVVGGELNERVRHLLTSRSAASTAWKLSLADPDSLVSAAASSSS